MAGRSILGAPVVFLFGVLSCARAAAPITPTYATHLVAPLGSLLGVAGDESFLVYSAPPPGPSPKAAEIWVAPLPSGTPKSLGIADPTVRVVGRTVVFGSAPRFIWTPDLDAPFQIGGAGSVNLSFSFDGTIVAFDEDLFSPPDKLLVLNTATCNGTTCAIRTVDQGASFATLSPDDQSGVYFAQQGHSEVLRLFRTDTMDIKTLTSTPGEDEFFDMQFSPDSTLVFAGSRGARGSLGAYSTATGLDQDWPGLPNGRFPRFESTNGAVFAQVADSRTSSVYRIDAHQTKLLAADAGVDFFHVVDDRYLIEVAGLPATLVDIDIDAQSHTLLSTAAEPGDTWNAGVDSTILYLDHLPAAPTNTSSLSLVLARLRDGLKVVEIPNVPYRFPSPALIDVDAFLYHVEDPIDGQALHLWRSGQDHVIATHVLNYLPAKDGKTVYYAAIGGQGSSRAGGIYSASIR
jgi:hypothetical protein